MKSPHAGGLVPHSISKRPRHLMRKCLLLAAPTTVVELAFEAGSGLVLIQGTPTCSKSPKSAGNRQVPRIGKCPEHLTLRIGKCPEHLTLHRALNTSQSAPSETSRSVSMGHQSSGGSKTVVR